MVLTFEKERFAYLVPRARSRPVEAHRPLSVLPGTVAPGSSEAPGPVVLPVWSRCRQRAERVGTCSTSVSLLMQGGSGSVWSCLGHGVVSRPSFCWGKLMILGQFGWMPLFRMHLLVRNLFTMHLLLASHLILFVHYQTQTKISQNDPVSLSPPNTSSPAAVH